MADLLAMEVQGGPTADSSGDPKADLQLVAQKWDYSKRRRPGRPGIMREISELIVRMDTRTSFADCCGSQAIR
jgi:hypothetical protein